MDTPIEPDSAALTGLMNEAVQRGIIDSAQRDRLAALAAELAPARPSTSVAAGASLAGSPEVRRGFNAITIAYSLGALLVIFALAWFLLERWRALGPGGVLGVALAYAGAFATVGVVLRRRGFEIAGGLALVLAIAMTPVWAWAVLRLTGEMPDPAAPDSALARYEPYMATRLIVLELATIGVGLATMRRVPFSVLAAPVAAALVALFLSLGQALGDPRLVWFLGPYYQCVVACALLAIAYAVERRQPEGEDFAFWFYLGGVIMVFMGYAQVWPFIGRWRHALPLVATAFVTASLYLRRRTLLVAGGIVAFAYLGYLAFDVFRRVVALPVALAALGLLVIVATVWMQRRFPALVERVSREDATGGKSLPTGAVAVIGPLAISLTVLLFAAREAQDRTAEREWRESIYRRRMRHEPRAAKRPPSPPLDSAPRERPR